MHVFNKFFIRNLWQHLLYKNNTIFDCTNNQLLVILLSLFAVKTLSMDYSFPQNVVKKELKHIRRILTVDLKHFLIKILGVEKDLLGNDGAHSHNIKFQKSEDWTESSRFF